MITVENKMSGWTIRGYEEVVPVFNSEMITLNEVISANLKQENMDYILDELRFFRGTEPSKDGSLNEKVVWFTTIDWDTILKISIRESYPEIEKELTEHFGKNWMNCYLRFGH